MDVQRSNRCVFPPSHSTARTAQTVLDASAKGTSTSDAPTQAARGYEQLRILIVQELSTTFEDAASTTPNAAAPLTVDASVLRKLDALVDMLDTHFPELCMRKQPPEGVSGTAKDSELVDGMGLWERVEIALADRRRKRRGSGSVGNVSVPRE